MIKLPVQYRLDMDSYSGTAGHSLLEEGIFTLDNMAFTTKDRDKDRANSTNCAAYYTGSLWYNACHNSNLNGKYLGEKRMITKESCGLPSEAVFYLNALK